MFLWYHPYSSHQAGTLYHKQLHPGGVAEYIQAYSCSTLILILHNILLSRYDTHHTSLHRCYSSSRILDNSRTRIDNAALHLSLRHMQNRQVEGNNLQRRNHRRSRSRQNSLHIRNRIRLNCSPQHSSNIHQDTNRADKQNHNRLSLYFLLDMRQVTKHKGDRNLDYMCNKTYLLNPSKYFRHHLMEGTLSQYNRRRFRLVKNFYNVCHQELHSLARHSSHCHNQCQTSTVSTNYQYIPSSNSVRIDIPDLYYLPSNQ